MKKIPTLLAAFLALAVLPAAAEPPVKVKGGWKTYAAIGYTTGGDVLVDGQYLNTGESFTLRAGKGAQVMVGQMYRLNEDWSVQAALGFHGDETKGTNGNFRFTRVPLELMVHRSLGSSWRVGLGLHKSLASKFNTSGEVSGYGSFSLTSEVGGVAEVQYLLQPLGGPGEGASAGFSVKVVDERFKVKEIQSVQRNGRHIGVSLFTYF